MKQFAPYDDDSCRAIKRSAMHHNQGHLNSFGIRVVSQTEIAEENAEMFGERTFIAAVKGNATS